MTVTTVTAALVDAAGIVENRIVHDPAAGYVPAEGLTLVEETEATGVAHIGLGWDGAVFEQPPPNPPSPPTPEQIRKALFQAAVDRAQIITVLNMATPAAIDAWADVHANSAAELRAFVKAILKVLAADPPS